MTVTLYVDTATTGRYHYREPDDAAIQPHLCRLSAVLVEDGDELLGYCNLIQPQPGWTSEVDAIVAHGIHPSDAAERGVPIGDAIDSFRRMKEAAGLLVAFNYDHHSRVLTRAGFDCGIELMLPLTQQDGVFCAMREATDVVRKPRYAPGGGYAWPKLAEAYAFFAGGDLVLPLDSVDRGLMLARAVRTIHEGILQHRSTP